MADPGYKPDYLANFTPAPIGNSPIIAPGSGLLTPQSDLGSIFTSTDKVTQGFVPRLAISVEALDKRGKTYWALNTTPEPVAVITNDPGTIPVLKEAKELRGRKIPWVIEQNFDRPDPHVKSAAQVDKTEEAKWAAEWAKFNKAMTALKNDTTVKTLVIDNGSDLANLCELAYFGKLKGNARMDLRAQYNEAMSKWFWMLYKAREDLNIVIIHRLKKEYKKDSTGKDGWTGGYERQGWNQMGYMVDFSLRLEWDPIYKDFYSYIDEGAPTRFGVGLLGKRWYSRGAPGYAAGQNDFRELAMSVFPMTMLTPEIWGLPKL